MIPIEGSCIETKFLKDCAPLLSSTKDPCEGMGAQRDQLKILQNDASDPENNEAPLPPDDMNSIPSRHPTVRPCHSAGNSKLTPSETAGRLAVTSQEYSDMPTCSPFTEEHQSFFPTPTSVSRSSHVHIIDSKFLFYITE